MNKDTPITIIQGDTCFEQFSIKKDGVSLGIDQIHSIHFTVGSLNIKKALSYDPESKKYILTISSEETSILTPTKTSYDLTVVFIGDSTKTIIYNSPFNVLKKNNRVLEI